MSKQIILFCDFDGTITEKDNIAAIMRRFAPPEAEPLMQKILTQQMSIREGVGQLFAMLPSALKDEIVQFIVKDAKIRPGFEQFVRFCDEAGIELLITSGGIDFFVYPILARFQLENRIYCNGSDFSQDRITITWPHRCDEHCSNDCGMCKTAIIRGYDSKRYQRIVIGDSITDLAGAKIADFVIARSLLEQKCQELGLPYQPFATFYDVIHILQNLQTIEEVKLS
ncbi:2-hydroxy-3-keto-5-methylthiopentenyl-1-phosphate phosphatase [Brevibacillus sp. B_LB10_24]|uniref:2-hydroxy-3-keto-5-methylthiopentenyl-1- phosphate phosphatase n=1 Tax=Brevibacillus sp. B_LB10_24 TaxID=3380645 RepID=UPI0038BDBB80